MRVSTIFAALALIPLSLKAKDISGQVFIVTRGAETIKLALVPIAAYKKEDVLATVKAVDVEFTKAREKTVNFVQAIHEAYKEADTARQHASPESLQSFFSPGPDAAYEIAHGQRLKAGEYAFPLVLFGSAEGSRPRYCKLVVVHAGKDDWAVERLP